MENDKPLSLKDSVNDEEFLILCLEVCANDPLMFTPEEDDGWTMSEVERDAFFLASKVIVWYIMLNNTSPLTETEVQDQFMEMVVDHILTKQVKEGNVEASFHDDGQIRYSITEQGKQKVFSNVFMKNMQENQKKDEE